MRTHLLLSLCAPFALVTHAQTVVYDFAQDPLSNGWSSVLDPGSGNGITYDAGGQQIQFDITTGIDKNFIHRTLPYELKEAFCVSFKIRPEATNINSFFPLVLTPNSLAGPNSHPWRMNSSNGVSAGTIQNLDFLGVIVTHMEILFVNRNDNLFVSNTMLPFSQPFIMSANTDYWVKLEVIDDLNTRLCVYSDAAMNNELRNQIFANPNLDAFNELYIANCNGNSNTNIKGKLDDYTINGCSLTSIEEMTAENDAWVVYPNPSSSVFQLSGEKNIDFITIYDVRGARVVHDVTINNNHASLKLEDESGVYFVEIHAEDGSVCRTRLLLQH